MLLVGKKKVATIINEKQNKYIYVYKVEKSNRPANYEFVRMYGFHVLF